jgi:hypothetical protein
MNLWLVAGGSIGSIVVGIAIAFGLDHVAWRLSEEVRRRHAGRRGGTLDLRQRI